MQTSSQPAPPPHKPPRMYDTPELRRARFAANLMAEYSREMFASVWFKWIPDHYDSMLQDAYFDDDNCPTAHLKFLVTGEMLNSNGVMDSGAATTFVDVTACLAQCILEEYWADKQEPDPEGMINLWGSMGLSRQLRVQFLRPLQIDMEVHLFVSLIGRTPDGGRYFRVLLKDSDGSMLAYGNHDMAALPKHLRPKL